MKEPVWICGVKPTAWGAGQCVRAKGHDTMHVFGLIDHEMSGAIMIFTEVTETPEPDVWLEVDRHVRQLKAWELLKAGAAAKP